ncbi:MAG: hypothetical protein LBM97_00340 [Candidatus Nomurabacteria bacterium]|nr:hypothetical protein [Candidatus Nomurabacteria bacterium]
MQDRQGRRGGNSQEVTAEMKQRIKVVAVIFGIIALLLVVRLAFLMLIDPVAPPQAEPSRVETLTPSQTNGGAAISGREDAVLVSDTWHDVAVRQLYAKRQEAEVQMLTLTEMSPVLAEVLPPIEIRYTAISDGDKELLAKIVYLECAPHGVYSDAEDAASRQAIAEIILNRLQRCKYYSKLGSMEAVLSDARDGQVQFTTWKNLAKANPSEYDYAAIERALSGAEGYILPATCEKGRVPVFFNNHGWSKKIAFSIGGKESLAGTYFGYSYYAEDEY